MKTLGLLLILSFIILFFNCEAQGTWTQKADFGGTARFDAVGFSIGSKGYIGTGSDGFYLKDFWEYDNITNVWTQKANFAGTARERAVGFSIGSKGYIGTGYNGHYKNDFWEYDPSTNGWTQKADFGGTARYFAVGFSIGSKGYIGTGFYSSSYPYYANDFWEYDTLTNGWTQKANFGGTARSNAVGVSISSKGYVGGGYDGNLRNDFWEFDPDNNSWTQKAYFGGTERADAVGFSIGNKRYIGTGDSSGGYLKKDFWEYTPDCTAPIGLVATNITNSKATLSWSAVSGGVKYKVRYRVSGNNPWTNVGSTTTTRKINGLSAGTTYQWQVRTVCSIDPSVSSDWSPKESFTTSLRLSGEESPTSSLSIYPNPFISSTTISFSLEEDSYISMELLDVSGKKLQQLIDENLEAGNHDVSLQREQLCAGIYFLKIKMNDQSTTMKVVVE